MRWTRVSIHVAVFVCILPRIFLYSDRYLLDSMPDGSCHARAQYLEQETIDSLIQYAFFQLNTAMTIAGHGFRQKDAIIEAKRVVTKLKNLSRGDPNEKYVRWKVSELEYQIFLEENDLLHEQWQHTQARANDLIVRFNAQIGKSHPDFVTLRGIEEQMKQLDEAKAEELKWLVGNRIRNVSRDVIARIEHALQHKNYGKAREELDYCMNNRGLLAVTPVQYGRLEARLHSQINADDVKGYVEKDIVQIKELLSRNNLHGARTSINGSERRLAAIKADIPAQEWERHTGRLNSLSRIITSKEDSLVNVSIALYNQKGKNAAVFFMEHMLTRHGVSAEKIAEIDRAIIDIVASEQTHERASGGNEFIELTQQDKNEISELDRLHQKAKKIARARADSIRIAAEEQSRIARIEWLKKNRSRLRKEARMKEKQERQAVKERQRLALAIEKQRLKTEKKEARERAREASRQKDVRAEIPEIAAKPLPPTKASGYQTPPSQPAQPVIPAAPAFQSSRDTLREKAEQCVMQIYELLEQNKIDLAYSRFYLESNSLEQYICKEAYETLKYTVNNAYSFSQFGNGL